MSQAEDSVMQALAARYREWGGGPVMKSGAPSHPYLTGRELIATTGLSADDVIATCKTLIDRGLVKNQIDQALLVGLTEAGQRQLGL
jgi:hypothetical protein